GLGGHVGKQFAGLLGIADLRLRRTKAKIPYAFGYWRNHWCVLLVRTRGRKRRYFAKNDSHRQRRPLFGERHQKLDYKRKYGGRLPCYSTNRYRQKTQRNQRPDR